MEDTRSTFQTWFDHAKWAVGIAAILAAVYANAYIYAAEPALYRALGMIGVFALTALLLMSTAQGKALWALARGSRVEVRRVVWPGRTETFQVTALVIGVTILMALILWGLDSLLSWLISLLLG
ncbi:MAG: preprotein translocase subunit SecE [Gammaproteobacteria bacterium AqS3]|nr:preprotein translocase subunit SecE [Gammaproteobacteria bacterium AqS3]